MNTSAGEVSREIHFVSNEEGAGQFCYPALKYNGVEQFLVLTILITLKMTTPYIFNTRIIRIII